MIWKRHKCEACSKKVKKKDGLFTLKLEAIDGAFTMTVCSECAQLLNVIVDRLEQHIENKSLGLDYDLDIYDPVADNNDE